MMSQRFQSWIWFCAWAVLGALAITALISFVVPFVVIAVVVSVGVVVVLRRTTTQAFGSVFGLLAGAGLLLVWVGFHNRNGPGESCWQTATAGGCSERLSPFPWLLLGGAFMLGAVIGQWRRNRRVFRRVDKGVVQPGPYLAP